MSVIRFMPPRGTAAQANAYVGTLGEIFVDTTNWNVRVSDGSLAGGHILGGGGVSTLKALTDTSIVATGPAYAAGQYLRWGANLISAPVQSVPSTATTGGTLAAGTYYYVVTALTSYGETVVSNEKSQVTTGSTSTVTVNWAAVTGATGYRIYRGTSTGAENVYFQVGTVTTFTDTNGTSLSASPPTVNTTGSWQNAALAWADLTGAPTTLGGYGITDAVHTSRNVSTGTGLAGGGDLSADRTLSLATRAANSIMGNNTGSAATPADLTAAQVKSLLAITHSDVSGLATSATTDTTNASNISSGTLGAGRLPAFTGDVTSPAGSSVNTIAAAAVTLAKMANLAANSIVGNNTGSAATPVALTASQVKTLLAIGTADVAGITGISITGSAGWLAGGGSATDANAARATGLNVFNNTTGCVNFPTSAGITVEARRATGSTSDDGTFQLYASCDSTETLSFRKVTGYSSGDTWSTWRTVLHDGNYNSYALPLTGGTLTGGASASLTLSQSSASPWSLVLNRSDLGSTSDAKVYNSSPSAGSPALTTNCPFTATGALTATTGYLYGYGGGEMVRGAVSDSWLRLNEAGAFTSGVYTPGAMRVDGGLSLGGNVTLSLGAGNCFEVTNSYGYGQFGPQNTSYCHMETDRPAFYFSKPIQVNGVVTYYGAGAYPHYASNSYTGGAITVQSGGSASGGASGDIFFIY